MYTPIDTFELVVLGILIGIAIKVMYDFFHGVSF